MNVKIFEIHVTGDESIHEIAKLRSHKTIVIDLLRPDGSVMRTEHMTSIAAKFLTVIGCHLFVSDLVCYLEANGVNIFRVKIESPYYEEYKPIGLYMESHFEAEDFVFPTSKNKNKTTLLATDRQYKQDQYDAFRKQYKGKEVELCLYDTNIVEDADWFDLYKKHKVASKPTELNKSNHLFGVKK